MLTVVCVNSRKVFGPTVDISLFRILLETNNLPHSPLVLLDLFLSLKPGSTLSALWGCCSLYHREIRIRLSKSDLSTSSRTSCLTDLQIEVETMAANHLPSSQELCLTQQQSDLQLETMFTARITTLPQKDTRNPIWANSCCLRCAKLIGIVDLFCVPFLDKGVYKHIRCFNLRIKCTALPRDCVDDFVYVQQRFQYSGLERAFEARNAWIDRMNLESPSLGIEQFREHIAKFYLEARATYGSE